MKKTWSIILMLIALLVITVGVVLGFKAKILSQENRDSLELYLIGTEKSKFALFNENGEQLSDFLYNETILDSGNIQYLSGKKDNLVFTKDGKTLFKNEEIKDYVMLGSYYHKVKKANKLYNYKGQELEIYDADKMEIIGASRNYLLLKDNKSFKLINADRELVYSLEKKVSKEEVKLQDFNDVVILSFDNTAYVIDIKAQKIINTILIGDYVNFYGRTKDLNVYINLYEDKAIYEIYHKEEKLRELVDGDCAALEIVKGNLICSDFDELKTDVIITKSGFNYAELDGNAVKIFKDSKEVAKIENATLEDFDNYFGIYTLKMGDEYVFYDMSAKRIFSDKKFLYASSFAKDGNAIVSVADEKRYLMNRDGKKLSKDYSYIDFLESDEDVVYRAIDGERNFIALDAKFKEIYKEKEEKINVEFIGNTLFYTRLYERSEKLDVISPYKGKIIENKKVKFKNNYIIAEDGKENIYINFNGKTITKLKR